MKKMNLPICMLVGLSMAVTGYSQIGKTTTRSQPKSGTKTKFLDRGNMDTTISPGENFWMYANGGWYKKAVIPATETGVGAFLDLRIKVREQLKSILKDISAKPQKAGTIEQQVADLYASGMDSTAIDQRGYEPVKPILNKITHLASQKEVMAFVAEEQTVQTPLLFGMGVGSDDKNSNAYLASFLQGGLGMPDRDYYFKNDPATIANVNAYKKYIKQLLVLTGYPEAKAGITVEKVFALEKELAAAHSTNVELRDPEANYNKMAVADLVKKYPNLDMAHVLATMQVKADSVNISQPKYFAKLSELINTTPLDTWKEYLKVHELDDAATFLSSAFATANFEYTGKALAGQQQQKPRWQRMITVTDDLLGDALGQIYVKKYFTEESKKRMDELVSNLTIAFEARINKLDWMSDSTKQVALAKLHTFVRKIGFPEVWKDYSSVKIDRSKYYENLEALSKLAYQNEVKKLGGPVDRKEWGMTPPTINAYYNPGFNEIVFPAGILQFPFFDVNADDAINYGGIGMVIGHEISHGFDDQGSQYDKDGNLKNWWNEQDLAKFGERGAKLINLYNSFTVLDTLHIKGELTQGENIADFGGVALAYDAFKLTKQGQGNTLIDGFTPDQRFFLSVAQIWRARVKDESMRKQVLTNPHSPAMFRVNGPLMNFVPFYQAFGIKEGDKMYKNEADRVIIW